MNETYFEEAKNYIYWPQAEAIFSQMMDERSVTVQTKPRIIGKNLVECLNACCSRHCVLVADLLPELVELKQFDLRMQAVLRRKWTIIDTIIDRWYQGGEESRIEVPYW